MARVRTDPAAGFSAGAALFLGAIALGGALTFAQSPPATPSVAPPAEPPKEERVVEVRVVGHKRVPIEKIVPHIRTRAGRVFNPDTVEEDVRRLSGTHLFVNVRPFIQKVEDGRVVIFEVLERPLLEYVKYVGNRQYNKKTLIKESGLKAGDPMDPFAVEEGRRKLEAYYQSKGFTKVQVTVIEGSKAGDRGAIILIDEGPKQKVLWTTFEGNTIASDARLRTLIQSKPGFFWLFKGTLDRKQLEEDVNRLTAYYRGLGFFQARVGHPLLDFNESQNWVTVSFVIDEGPRYQVRNISVIGNTKFPSETLLKDLKLKQGEYFNQASMNADKFTIQDMYGGVGYVFADVSPDPRFLEEPGKLDLVYHVNEGSRYRVGRVNVEIKGEYPHTRIATVLNRISLQPGDIVDVRELRASERRLKSSGLFKNDPMSGASPKIVFTPPDQDKDKEEAIARQPKPPSRSFRGQSPDPESQTGPRPPAVGPDGAPDRRLDVTLYGESTFVENPHPWAESPDASQSQPGVQNRSADGRPPLRWGPPAYQATPAAQPDLVAQAPGQTEPAFSQPAQAMTQEAPAPANFVCQAPQPWIVRGQYSADAGWSTPPLPSGSPLGGTRSSVLGGTYGGQPQAGSYLAQGNSTPLRTVSSSAPLGDGTGGLSPGSLPLGPNPDVGAAVLGNPRWDDTPRDLPLNSIVQETETGRLMFSVGVNSEAGLIGSVVIDEQNFDWTRPPTSWEDIRNRTAWRGAGQRFRAEAMPGTQVQRYTVSFQEPYLLDTAVSLSLSGFFYDRIYTDWTEERVGGRLGLGYQFTHDLSGTVAYRGARINVFNPITMGVEELDRALGISSLHGFQLGLTHDTRDSPFLATEGHLLSLSFEQVIGTFQYPRAEIELRQYFMLRQHPDGSGRHVLSLGGRAGYTGDDTPIYEHFFAGGFSTIRGFRFRGASPIEFSSTTGYPVTVGGKFELLASAEYMFPITADDALRGVVFVDTGTVEPKIGNWTNRYRVAPGFGLRITIPAMGPAPIALDLAFPVAYQPGDRLEAFSFWIGFLR